MCVWAAEATALTTPPPTPLMELSTAALTCSNMEICVLTDAAGPLCLCAAPLDSDDVAFFHEGARGCLGVQDHSLILSSSCEDVNQRWKWVTRDRLFNLGSSLCLGVTTGNLTSSGGKPSLGVYACDRDLPSVYWTWKCEQLLDNLNNYLPLPSLWNSSNPSVPYSPSLKWTLHGGLRDLCSKTYRGTCVSNPSGWHCDGLMK